MAVERVKDSFKDTDVNVIELLESSATVALAAQALNTEPDQIAKTLSFLVDDAPILDVMAGEASTDNHKYKAKMIPVDQVEDYIGGVCPFAVKVYLDESLKRHTEVYPAAGSSNSAVRLTIPALEKYSDYTAWVDVTKTA